MNWNVRSISRSEFITEWITSTHNRNYNPKWGESSYATGERVAQLINDLNLTKPQHIVLVTHGGAIADYLRNCFKDVALVSLQKKYPEGTGYRLFNCSITSLKYQPEPKIKLINYVAHLDNVSE